MLQNLAGTLTMRTMVVNTAGAARANSLRIVLAADESIRAGQAVTL